MNNNFGSASFNGQPLGNLTGPVKVFDLQESEIPCAVNIIVLAGLQKPCQQCAKQVEEFRVRLKFFPVEGRPYWISNQLTPEQKRYLEDRIAERVERCE